MKQSDYKEKFLKVRRLWPLFSLLAFFIFKPIQANELIYNYQTYKEAQTADQYIKFESSSTKLGFITTKFDGYILKYKVQYELEKDEVKNVDIIIATNSLDTDLGARNEKMRNDILDMSKYPEIFGKLTDKVPLRIGEQEINMVFTVKGKSFSKSVKINVTKMDKSFVIHGTTIFSLKEFELPDPSIVIAKVNDSFDLSFSIRLN